MVSAKIGPVRLGHRGWDSMPSSMTGSFTARCKVCCIPTDVDGYLDFRATMRSMVGYYSVARIHRELEGFFPRWPSRIRFSDESLRNHVNEHLTGKYAAMRQIRILEARKDHGAALEDIQENFFSPMANLRQITEAMMQQFHEGQHGSGHLGKT